MMPIDQYILEEIGDRLREWIADGRDAHRTITFLHDGAYADALVEVGGYRLAIEYKSVAGAAAVDAAAQMVKKAASQLGNDVIPLVAVPYMGETGQRICEDAGVSWLDLSGNARIKAPGLRVWIEGHENRFKERGRPSNAFAPKSARIARWLLSHPGEVLSQRELAHNTGMDEGQTSRVISRLIKSGLITRDSEGCIQVKNRRLLLEAWHEVYDFSKHKIIKGHVAARSGEELMMRLANTLTTHQQSYAMTGLAAAWQMTHFSAFKLTTVYLERRPEPTILEALGFRQEDRGANTWLIFPNDAGVFQGAESFDGIRCVHPVQAYMDLKSMPERASEAAEHIRGLLLSGDPNVG